jgi:hypothetical protein
MSKLCNVLGRRRVWQVDGFGHGVVDVLLEDGLHTQMVFWSNF